MIKRTHYPLQRNILLVAFIATFLVSACSKSSPKIEAAPSVPTAVAEAPTVQVPNLSPPKPLEVQDAVQRVFKDAVVIDNSRTPSFIAGDFNGDFSQDLAVVLKVAPGKVDQMNEQYPMWMLRDPFAATEPSKVPLKVSEGDILLAVIHGFGPNDWRDPQATQTYLLKNAVGSGMEVHSPKDLATADRLKRVPQLRGDVIGQVLKGDQGYLYYAETTYAWYDPRKFKGESTREIVHGKRMGT